MRDETDSETALWQDIEEQQQRQPGEPRLVVDVDGFEGPLDLLLTLARDQKVDLTRISILALAEQYLLFIEKIRKLRIELAADYLVMAAWLAYMKSRLLLPEPEKDDEPTGEELAEALAFRLRRLEAMRKAADQLLARPQLRQDIFPRGMPEGVTLQRRSEYVASLYDLLKAYVIQRQKQAAEVVYIHTRDVWSLQEARDILNRLVGSIDEWSSLNAFLLDYLSDPETRRTVIASSFTASLEMAKEGVIELRQTEAFSPLYMRRKAVDDNLPGEQEENR